MADKSFGVKDINLIGASGTPTIDSPNNLNINAINVAISTDITVGNKLSLGTGTSISSPGTNILALGTNNLERIRVGSAGQIGLGGANYGTSGQVLTSGGASGAVSWTTACSASTSPARPSEITSLAAPLPPILVANNLVGPLISGANLSLA